MPGPGKYIRHPKYKELFKYPGSAVWWAFLPRSGSGRMPRESTGHRDDVAAHAWYLNKIRTGAAEAVPAETKKERSLLDALNARIQWLKSARENDDPTRRKRAQATVDFYIKKGRPLLYVLGPQTLLSEIGHEEIRKYIIERSKTARATTVAKELTTLSMAMAMARKDGVSCQIFKDIKPEDFAADYVPKERWLTEPEVDALLEVLPRKRGAVVAFIVATSATYPSEVVGVKRAMVNSKTYVVRVPGTKRKTRDRVLRVPPYAKRFLDFAVKHASGGPGGTMFEPWSNVRGDLHDAARLLSMCKPCRDARLAWARHEDGAEKPSKEKCKACEKTKTFEPLSPNDLRRTFAQWLVRSGVPYELGYPMMGHDSPRMLELVYGKRDATAVADLVELALQKAPPGARFEPGVSAAQNRQKPRSNPEIPKD